MRFKVGKLFCPTLTFLLLTVVHGMNVDLYLNKDKFGEYFKLEISEKGCTNVPLNWENQAASIDTHGSCIKFYDLPYCRGKFVALQPYHGTFQDNLATVGFDKIISSASPCGPKVPAGRYYLQNGADGSVLTIETRNGSAVARTKAFRPYITKGQQFQVEKVALADYELIPRVHEKMNPITFDMSVSTGNHPVRRTWKIESVYRGKYIIKNEWNNKCLYKSENGKVEEHECVIWSPNQEWMFRSIKVKPFFPSKEELTKRPIRPYDDFPFDPQQIDFNQVGQQLSSPGLKNRFRPKHPAVALGFNPKEPFPPVLPRPILPGPVLINKKAKPKAPVPLVRHPGPLPFPPEPLVTVPRKPITGLPKKPLSKVAKEKKKKKKDENEDENEDEEEKKSEEKELDDARSEEKDAEKKSEENDKSEEKELDDKKSEEKESDDKKSEEETEKKSEEEADKKSEEEKESEEKPSAESVEKEEEDEDDGRRDRERKTKIKAKQPEQEDDPYQPKYSDFRLYF